MQKFLNQYDIFMKYVSHFAKKDIEGILDLFSEDGYYLGCYNNELAFGKEEIREKYNQLLLRDIIIMSTNVLKIGENYIIGECNCLFTNKRDEKKEDEKKDEKEDEKKDEKEERNVTGFKLRITLVNNSYNQICHLHSSIPCKNLYQEKISNTAKIHI